MPNEQFFNYIMASFYNSISENMKTEVLQYFEKPSYTWQLHFYTVNRNLEL